MSVLFHLAFPCHDFDKAKKFYCDGLGFSIGRESSHALIINFADNQIVAHKIDFPLEIQEGIYPRHFGLIFTNFSDYETLVKTIEGKHIDFHIKPKIRFENTSIEHHSFFIADPSNNLLEFKYYTNETAIFGETDFNQVGET